MATAPPSYTRQVLPRPAPLPQPGPNAGQEIAEGLGALGEATTHHQAILIERNRQAESAQAAVGLAQLSGDADVIAEQRRQTAEPDGSGHVDAVMGDVRSRVDDYLGTIRDPRVRDAYVSRAAEILARTRASEVAWVAVKSAAHRTLNITSAVTKYSNQLPNDASIDDRFFQTIPAIRQMIAESGLSPAQQEQVTPELLGSYAEAYANRRMSFDPQGTLEALRGHALDDLLPAGAKDHLTRAADTEVRVREADQRREQTAARAQAQQSIDMLQARLRQHDPTISDADLQQTQQLAQAAGIPIEAYNLNVARAMHQVDQQYARPGHQANPVELRAAIGQLDTRIAAGGEHADPLDVVRRNHLQSLLEQREREVAADPQSGMPGGGQPMDFGNPASVQAGINAARAAQRMTGHFQPLIPQQAELLKQQVASGPDGRLIAINEIAAMNQFDPAAARAAAEQVAPGDAAFGFAVRTGTPAVRQMIVSGAAARHGMARVERDDGTMSTAEAEARAIFEAEVAPALRHYDASFAEGLFQASLNIYAEKRRRAQVLGDTHFDAGGYRDSVNDALGRDASGGGMGTHNGAPVTLPTGVTQAEFDRRWAFLPYDDPHQRGWINGRPMWANGREVSRAELRSQFTLLPVGDGVYQLARGNELLHTQRGVPVEININRVTPPRYSGAGAVTGRSLVGRGDPESVRHPEDARAFWGAPPAPAPRR